MAVAVVFLFSNDFLLVKVIVTIQRIVAKISLKLV
jgi:hypothetical protein